MIYESIPQLINAVVAYAETDKAYRISKEVTFEGVAETSQANIAARDLVNKAIEEVAYDLYEIIDRWIDDRSTASVDAELDRLRALRNK